MLTFLISFFAGMLTTLSPCVLPVLPLIVGSAFREHRLAPISTALGMVTSFVVVGWSIAAFGGLFGIDQQTIRVTSAFILGFFGLVLLSANLQGKFSKWTSPLVNSAQRLSHHPKLSGHSGQFFVGILLGALWSPCSGPTLGTAITLAAQGGAELRSGLMLLTFGVGAAIPMLLIAYGAQGFFSKNRDKVLRISEISKLGYGALMLLISTVILAGFDKKIEAYFVGSLPSSLMEYLTKY